MMIPKSKEQIIAEHRARPRRVTNTCDYEGCTDHATYTLGYGYQYCNRHESERAYCNEHWQDKLANGSEKG